MDINEWLTVLSQRIRCVALRYRTVPHGAARRRFHTERVAAVRCDALRRRATPYGATRRRILCERTIIRYTWIGHRALRRYIYAVRTVRSRACSRAGCPWCSRTGRAAADRRSTGRIARATNGPSLAAGTGPRSAVDIRSRSPSSARPSSVSAVHTFSVSAAVDAHTRRYRRHRAVPSLQSSSIHVHIDAVERVSTSRCYFRSCGWHQ